MGLRTALLELPYRGMSANHRRCHQSLLVRHVQREGLLWRLIGLVSPGCPVGNPSGPGRLPREPDDDAGHDKAGKRKTALCSLARRDGPKGRTYITDVKKR